MSEVSQVNNTRNQLTSNYDFSKIFIGDNKYRKVTLAATAALNVKIGTVIGAVGATIGIYKSGTSNQLPIGVIAETVVMPSSGTLEVTIVNAGKIAEGKLVLNGTDTLATVVSNRTIRDMIISNTIGVELVTVDELSATDNV